MPEMRDEYARDMALAIIGDCVDARADRRCRRHGIAYSLVNVVMEFFWSPAGGLHRVTSGLRIFGKSV
jgi:hypothetical protein